MVFRQKHVTTKIVYTSKFKIKCNFKWWKLDIERRLRQGFYLEYLNNMVAIIGIFKIVIEVKCEPVYNINVDWTWGPR